jgi:hypothetical protein
VAAVPNCGVRSVVVCTLVCETGSTGSIPVGHPSRVKYLMKDFPALCIDDFYSDPDHVRNFALSLDYSASPDGAWPGKRTAELCDVDRNFFDEFCKKIFSLYFDLEHVHINYVVSTRFQIINPLDEDKHSAKNTGWIHFDHDPFAGIIYLTPEIDRDCGTSLHQVSDPNKLDDSAKDDFYLHGIDNDYDQRLIDSNSGFTETVRFQNIYNRLICFDGHTAHGANYLYTENLPRLTQVFFVKKLEVSAMGPMQRHRQFL